MPRQIRHRRTVRVLPVNADGQVLLLHGWDPAKPEKPYWFTIGGEVDEGEFMVEAASRELREETGLVVRTDELTAPVSREVVEFDWGIWHVVQDQTFFAVRLDDAEGLHFKGLNDLERGTIDKAEWWDPDALDAAGTAASGQLTTHMRTAVRTILGDR